MSLSHFLKLRFRLGTLEAIKLYPQLHVARAKSLQLPGLRHAVHLGAYPEGAALAEEILINKIYRIPFKMQVNRIIDCGANIGFTSIFYANTYPEAHIVAVEPEKRNFDLLKKNTAPYNNIVCLNKGIWNERTYLKIAREFDAYINVMVTPTNDPAEAICEAVTIQNILDDQEWDQADVVKMDVQGAEKAIFSSNHQWMEKTKLLILELHEKHVSHSSQPAIKALLSYGFRFFIYHNLLFCLRDSDHNGSLNQL
jgi:FkbM family methyltransferase